MATTVWSKVLDSTDPVSGTVTADRPVRTTMTAAVWSGVDPSDPVSGEASAVDMATAAHTTPHGAGGLGRVGRLVLVRQVVVDDHVDPAGRRTGARYVDRHGRRPGDLAAGRLRRGRPAESRRRPDRDH